MRDKLHRYYKDAGEALTDFFSAEDVGSEEEEETVSDFLDLAFADSIEAGIVLVTRL